jgi:HlyD family secretion protein
MAKPNTTKRRIIRWTKRVLLVVGGLGIVAAIVRALMPDPIVVDTATVTRGPLDVEVLEDGQTRVRDRFVIAAPIAGDLERITIDAGTWVEGGASIARIAPPAPALLDDRTRSETIARLAVARAHERRAAAATARARQTKELAVIEARRARELFASGAVTGSDRDRAVTSESVAIEDLVAAEHQRAAASAEIAALRAVLEPRSTAGSRIDVVAPASGRVLRVLRESEGPVGAGTPLVELGDPTSLEVVVEVLSRDAERIAPGMDVFIETAGTRPLRGTVSLVEPSAFTRISALGVEEQRVKVIVCFDAPTSLGDAFRVDARIVIWHGADVLRAPSSALFRHRGHWAAYVIAGGRAHLRTVELGRRGRLEVEVVRGFAPGDRVILYPSDRVRDDARVVAR